MPDRSASQHATVTSMIDVAERMARETQTIARRDIVELDAVELSEQEDARLGDALLHVEQALGDLQRLRSGRRPTGPR